MYAGVKHMLQKDLGRAFSESTAKAHTCSGLSINVLSPIVKETSGMEATAAQSTDDCPMGLGSRSHS